MEGTKQDSELISGAVTLSGRILCFAPLFRGLQSDRRFDTEGLHTRLGHKSITNVFKTTELILRCVET